MNVACCTEGIGRICVVAVGERATLLGYQPTHRIGEGLKVAMGWYVGFVNRPQENTPG